MKLSKPSALSKETVELLNELFKEVVATFELISWKCRDRNEEQDGRQLARSAADALRNARDGKGEKNQPGDADQAVVAKVRAEMCEKVVTHPKFKKWSARIRDMLVRFEEGDTEKVESIDNNKVIDGYRPPLEIFEDNDDNLGFSAPIESIIYQEKRREYNPYLDDDEEDDMNMISNKQSELESNAESNTESIIVKKHLYPLASDTSNSQF